ncbi:hypothetical protein POM88_051212 [Heracleum sosnowskyi]|uniref:Transposase n=1 Tax=Heracleum sosnowskyi TaxID=360622 RepID=A0AAD8H1U4_9APIA|nr:hypothetical protein POM88_051212 [Heracleum sosnowskyi]
MANIIEDMKKATMSKVNKQSSSNVNEESQKKLYTVIVYYEGYFVHIPVFSYTTNTSKIYENVDLEELSVPELKVYVGDILGEFDSLYYILHTGIRLFTSTNKDELVELSKQCDYTATFYVYHQTPTDWDDDIDNFGDDETYSDEEFNEIRKATKEDRLRMEEFEKEYETNNGSESESYTSYCSASYDDFSSEEESDREVCYAAPPKFKKGKKVEEIFNAKTAARDIKWKVCLGFDNKIEFKEAIRSSSMETGRPYQYLVDDLKRIQVGCAKGCPFKMWTTYIEATQGWQEEFKKELKVDVGEWKCCRVRQKALRAVEDKMMEHYANVRRFGGEILRNGTNKTLISDQQKGLDKAIRELMPFVEHRLCTRHLMANMKKNSISELARNIFWDASCATHPQAFKSAMKALERASKQTYVKMNDLDPASWSKAFFKTHSSVDST